MPHPHRVDIASKKLPAILIAVLLVILVVQYVSNDAARNALIDPETCQLYTKDSQIGSRHYLDEFDSKCLEFKDRGP